MDNIFILVVGELVSKIFLAHGFISYKQKVSCLDSFWRTKFLGAQKFLRQFPYFQQWVAR
jgi:hypothetical protein